MSDGTAGRSLYADVERIFLHDCSGKKEESGLPEKYVSVTIQKTCDGVFIKRRRRNTKTLFAEGRNYKRGLTERKINAIFEVTYMTDGSGVYHGEYKGLKPTVWAV